MPSQTILESDHCPGNISRVSPCGMAISYVYLPWPKGNHDYFLTSTDPATRGSQRPVLRASSPVTARSSETAMIT